MPEPASLQTASPYYKWYKVTYMQTFKFSASEYKAGEQLIYSKLHADQSLAKLELLDIFTAKGLASPH